MIIEAENLLLSGYSPHTTAGASNNLTIRLSDVPNPGNASCVFVQENGIYNLSIKHLDEWDGACTAKVYINNVLFYEWVWDKIEDGNVFIEQDCDSYYLCLDDTIRIEVTNNENEWGKIDFLRFIKKPDNYWKGTISNSTTWSTDTSPYVLSGDVTVAAGATLTVESGVTVVFLDSDSLSGGNNTNRPELIVNGQLVAGDVSFEGLPGDSIGAYLVINSDFVLSDSSYVTTNPHSFIYFNSKVSIEDSSCFLIGAGSTAEFQDSTTVNTCGKLLVDPHSTLKFYDDCIVDNSSTFRIRDETVVEFEPGVILLGNGELWAHEVTFKGSSSEYWEGIKLEGSSASSSYFSECFVEGSVDGFIIDESSPEIKLCTIHNVLKRGFNIDGSGSEPNIERNYVYSCGTYPLQLLFGANPVIYNNKFYAGTKAAVRIWGADGSFGRNEFRSNSVEGIFIYGTSSDPLFYAYEDDEDGNMFDLAYIGTDGVIIHGGFPEFGDYPLYDGCNVFKNRGGYYFIRNNTGSTILAELNWWPDGASGAFYGDVDYSPYWTGGEPLNVGPSWKIAASPYSVGFEKFKDKEYKEAMKELKEALMSDNESPKADKAVFKMAKAAFKLDSLTVLEPFLMNLKKSSKPEVRYQSRLWLSYLYAAQGDMIKSEKIAFEAPVGSMAERAELLALVSYYYSNDDSLSAIRIADILREKHKDDYIEQALEAAFEMKYDFSQDRQKFQTKEPEVKYTLSTFPNPFNTMTSIAFYVDKPGKIDIKIFNLLGQEVKTIVSEWRDAGKHSIHWGGLDNFGNYVSSGIYIVNLKIGNKYYSIKIAYVK